MLLLFCGRIPNDGVIHERADVLEINHLGQGGSVTDYLIFWELADEDGGYHAVTWHGCGSRHYKVVPLTDEERKWKPQRGKPEPRHQPGCRAPAFTWRAFGLHRVGGRWVCFVWRRHGRGLVRVECETLRETWTVVDPERRDLEVWPMAKRRPFAKLR